MRVTYGKDAAVVEFDGVTETLAQATAASGMRYANDKWELRGKGDEATLTDVKSGQTLASDCVAQKPAEPSLTGVLTGTVTYLQRVALPPNAIIEVQLADVSKQDVAATVIASQTITAGGAQAPIPFELVYDPAQIDPRMTHAVSARITVDGKLTWISATRNSALTRGAPMTGIEIVVQPAR